MACQSIDDGYVVGSSGDSVDNGDYMGGVVVGVANEAKWANGTGG